MRALATLSTLLLLATSAVASPIQFVQDRRSIDFPDDWGDYAPDAPFAPWDLELRLIDGSFVASQESSFTSNGFQGSGGVWVVGQYQYPVNADPVAASRAEFTFTLSQTTNIRIQGEIATSINQNPWETWVSIGIGGGGLGNIWREGLGTPDDPPGILRTFDETFTLPAGTYSFGVHAVAWGEHPGPVARWNVALSVPEPVLWPLLAVLVPLARRWAAPA